jgi:hypothetical protein
MRYGRGFMALVGLSVALAACESDDATGPIGKVPALAPLRVIEANGDITAALAEFQAVLGEPANGGGSGPQSAGRREIRWDGVPPDQTNNDAFPADFFRGNGLITTTDGIGTRVSDNDFADIDPSYAAQFESFSKVKTFMASGSTDMTLTFRLSGSDTPAVTSGIGIVFSDVDQQGTARMSLYDRDGGSLGTYEAPVRSDAAGHSFIGVAYDRPVIARVEVVSGESALGAGINDVSTGGTKDLVVTDDFLFGEPQLAE